MGHKPTSMLKNYIKVALRNLWKSKGFTAINIIGLAAGLGVCLLIVLYVMDELSYDRYNAGADRIYRLDADLNFNNTQFYAAASPKPLARTLLKDFPDFLQMVRLNNYGDVMVKKGGNWIQDHHSVWADSTFFKVFTVPMIVGDPNTALNEPHSLVIDETTAIKYFNSTDVIGKTLELEDHHTCKVTGVIRDIPKQSHFHFSFIRPLRDGYNQNDDDEWLSNNYESYVLAKPGVSRETLQAHLNQTSNINLGRQLQAVLHASLADLNKQGSHFRYVLMPLTDIHLHSNKSGDLEANGNITYVYVFSFIAILILVIACVNFMNLSTARSANRAKEVGIRKVAGSTKSNLIFQFLTESVLLSFFSLILALGLALLLLPMFNTLAGKELHASTLFSGRILPVLVLLVFVVGCLAGSYPAFYLSSFQPIKVLKGSVSAGFKSSWLRSSLVVFQFFISISLIIGTLVIYRQLNFIRNREIGYSRDQVLLIKNAYSAGDPVLTLRKQLKQIAGITNATLSGDMPSQGGSYSQNGWFRDPSLDAKDVVILTNMFVDEDYVPTLGMKMVKGRNFDPIHFPTDSLGIVINEAAAQLLGWKDPLDQKLYRPNSRESSGKMSSQAYHVVGVVKDFNYSSMHDKVLPAILNLSDNRGTLAIRFQGGNIPSLVHQVQTRWEAIAGGVPFAYTFMDNDFNNLYKAEEQTGQVFITFAIFAIAIACLGLFGLVTYAAEQRTKEIGIRKVLGASTTGLTALLSKDFIKLVLVASLIAFPVAWWAMNQWLQSFAYRIGISWWIFVVAGMSAILIALFTVITQTIRAALANPVSSLRSE
jgi:putative ABC transport system permease protein